jgi:hypothetical protein
VCVCQLLLSAVCLRIVHSFYFVFRLLNSLNLFTTKRKKRFVFVSVLISTRLLCVFHYAFRWVVGWLCFLFLYISVCMFVVCLSLPLRKNKQQRKIFFSVFSLSYKKNKNDKIEMIEFIVLVELIFFTIVSSLFID